MLFRRDYSGFSGGHLKLRDYFDHTSLLPGFRPIIFFTDSSSWDACNPWSGDRASLLAKGQFAGTWAPNEADIVFAEGMDWTAIPSDLPVPVINLVQGLRHADPEDPRHAFLGRPAIRICVSNEVADALRDTGKVNGPIHSIAACIDRRVLPPANAAQDIDVVIAGLKQPRIAERLSENLSSRGIAHVCLTTQLPRPAYLQTVARARVAVLLPMPREGFYLPALEAMALKALVVCPDCVGNRGFCVGGLTCLRPAYELEAIEGSVVEALGLSSVQREQLLAAAMHQVADHDLQKERAAFHRILSRI